MSWCNILQGAGSDYWVNDNFPGTFADFGLQIFTQEKINSLIVQHFLLLSITFYKMKNVNPYSRLK